MHIGASLPETYVIPRIAKLLDLTQQLDKDPDPRRPPALVHDPHVLRRPRNADDAARTFETLKARYAAATPEALRLGHSLVGFWNSLSPR
jgi:hypothetical protein